MSNFIILWPDLTELHFQRNIILLFFILCQRSMLRKDFLPDFLYHSFILELALCVLVVPRTWNIDSITIYLEPLDRWPHNLLPVVKWISHVLFGTVICRSRVWDFVQSFGFENAGLGLVAGFIHDCVHEGPDSVIGKRRGEFLSRFLCLFIKLITSRSHIRRYHRFRPPKPFLPTFRPINNSLMIFPNGRADIIIPRPVLSDLNVIFNIERLDFFGIVRVAEQYSDFSVLLAYDWGDFSLLVSFSQLQKVMLFLLQLFLPEFRIRRFGYVFVL